MSRIAFYILCSGEVLLSLLIILIGSDQTSQIPVQTLFAVWLISTIFFVIAGLFLVIHSTRRIRTDRVKQGAALQ